MSEMQNVTNKTLSNWTLPSSQKVKNILQSIFDRAREYIDIWSHIQLAKVGQGFFDSNGYVVTRV